MLVVDWCVLKCSEIASPLQLNDWLLLVHRA
jgi:hypothetical protein